MESKPRNWVWIVVAGVLIGLLVLGLLVVVLLLRNPPADPFEPGPGRGFGPGFGGDPASGPFGPRGFEVDPDDYASNGEMIYLTGFNEEGERIPFTGGPRWLYVHGGGCASCHGVDGEGGEPVMMLRDIPPNITYEHLVEEEHGEGEHGEEEEEHPPYTEELIERAIVEGLDPAGDPLSLAMPRWQMSEEEVEDLIEYLRTLD